MVVLVAVVTLARTGGASADASTHSKSAPAINKAALVLQLNQLRENIDSWGRITLPADGEIWAGELSLMHNQCLSTQAEVAKAVTDWSVFDHYVEENRSSLSSYQSVAFKFSGATLQLHSIARGLSGLKRSSYKLWATVTAAYLAAYYADGDWFRSLTIVDSAVREASRHNCRAITDVSQYGSLTSLTSSGRNGTVMAVTDLDDVIALL